MTRKETLPRKLYTSQCVGFVEEFLNDSYEINTSWFFVDGLNVKHTENSESSFFVSQYSLICEEKVSSSQWVGLVFKILQIGCRINGLLNSVNLKKSNERIIKIILRIHSHSAKVEAIAKTSKKIDNSWFHFHLV